VGTGKNVFTIDIPPELEATIGARSTGPTLWARTGYRYDIASGRPQCETGGVCPAPGVLTAAKYGMFANSISALMISLAPTAQRWPAIRGTIEIILACVHECRDRHGKLRRYVRRPGSRRFALLGLPSSPQFMQAYQDAISGPVLRRAPKAGTLAALAAEFFSSTEFANLRPSSQATYRLALAPILERDGIA